MNKKIIKLRGEINKIDGELLRTVAKRFLVVSQIGVVKIEHDLAVDDIEREQELAKLHEQFAKEFGLNRKFVGRLFKLIMEEAKRLQGLI